jgi:hypothetical protein
MKVMLKPDSHGLRLPLIGMKELSVCGLRFRSLILRLSGPFYSANLNCLLSTPQTSIFTTPEIKVISTPNGAEKKDSLTGDDEHGWVGFNKYFFTL